MDKKRVILLFRTVYKNALWIMFVFMMGTLSSCEGETLDGSDNVSSVVYEDYSRQLNVSKQFEPDPLPPIPQPDNRL